MEQDNLERFIRAQEKDYAVALAEVKSGRKRSHWMWYIFPQIAGLGYSETSKFYAIRDKTEAEAYMAHSVLGRRLLEISAVLLELDEHHAGRIFGSPDDMKLKSCMTLFDALPGRDPVFGKVLAKYFNGIRDWITLHKLEPLHGGSAGME